MRENKESLKSREQLKKKKKQKKKLYKGFKTAQVYLGCLLLF